MSTVTVTPEARRKGVRINDLNHVRSLVSMTSAMSISSDGYPQTGYKKCPEIRESDVRDDLVAWRLPGDDDARV